MINQLSNTGFRHVCTFVFVVTSNQKLIDLFLLLSVIFPFEAFPFSNWTKSKTKHKRRKKKTLVQEMNVLKIVIFANGTGLVKEGDSVI